MPSPNATPTPITPPRVPLIDPRTGLIDRAWYMFFLSLLNAATTVDDGDLGTSALSLIASYAAELEVLAQIVGTQFNAESMLASLEIAINTVKDQTNLQPPSETGELQQQIDTLRQEVETLPRPSLGTMAALQQAWLPWVTFDTAPEFTPPDVGTLAWDGGTTLGVQMTTNVLGRVNESGYYYIKASSAITKGDVVMFTGAVGASGVPTGAPATGLTDGSYIMGIAAESLALNAFGLVQFIGALRGVNTSVYADGDILWYDPAVTGGLTKTKPSAPNVKVQMAAVISAVNNGTILIRVNAGSELGGTDSNVQFGTLANGNIIQYDSALGYWKNVPLSTAGAVTSVTGTAPVVSSGGSTPAISLASGYGDTQNPYASKTANYVLAAPDGSAGVPTFRALVAADIPALSYVSSIGVTAPITSTGGLTPTIGITQSGTASNGYLSSTDWNTFNNKQSVSAPVTKTANFSVAATDAWIINNKSGSTCTATLPAAASYSGRVLHFQNYQAQTLVSASSNVVPLAGGAAGTSILLASAGDSATLVSDGSNWLMTQYVPNNILLLE